MPAQILKPTGEAIALACDILRQGGLVGLPTETVYGLAADASNPAAIARLYAAKGRPAFNPLIAHVESTDMARQIGVFPRPALTMAQAFWPGPLTMVVQAMADCPVCDLARAGLETVALRQPAHPAARRVLSQFGGAIAAPSANPSGQVSPTSAEHVAADMADAVDLILDGGPSMAGIESTIIDARFDTPTLLRPGSIDTEQIEAIWPGLFHAASDPKAPRSPGQLQRHYAPTNPIRLNVTAPQGGESFLAFGAMDGTANLSASADLVEAAANLFHMLRALDKMGQPIAVAPIPNHGVGEAINDRLNRAAQID